MPESFRMAQEIWAADFAQGPSFAGPNPELVLSYTHEEKPNVRNSRHCCFVSYSWLSRATMDHRLEMADRKKESSISPLLGGSMGTIGSA